MAIAQTKTGLALDRWAEIIGIHPLHFNQVQLNAEDGLCGYPILQFSWQSADHTSREAIAEAIQQAEQQIEMNLGYPLVGKWFEGEAHSFRTQSVHTKTDNYFVIEGGVETKTLIEAARPIVYSDLDADTYKETATITVTTTVTNIDELEIYYPGTDGDDGHEIRNTKVTISGGVATITFKRAQCLLEKFLTTMIDPRAQLGTDDTNFLDTVDVYRRYNDPSAQIEFQTFNSACNCGGSGCATCSYTVQAGCIRIIDGRNGLLALNAADWSTDDSTYYNAIMCRNPNRVKLNYYAGLGYKGSSVKMAPEWERAVAYYALSLLERPICRCSHLSNIGNLWKEDLAVVEGFGGRIQRSAAQNAIIQCPLGTTRAAINAWRLIQNYMIIEAGIHA